MGTARTQTRHCRRENVPYTLLRHLQDISDQHVNNVIADMLGAGVVSATIEPAETGVGLEITSFIGYSSAGHAKKASQSDIDLSGYTDNKWISVFATPDWTDSDYRLNGANEYDYHERTETATFTVVQGTATHLPANPGGGAIRVCSVKVLTTTTVITAGMIKTTGALNGTNYSDLAVMLNEKVSKAGDTLTGVLFYNEDGTGTTLPMPICNFGTISIPGSQRITGTGDPNFDYHWACISPYIDTGMPRTNLKVHVSFDMGFYLYDGSVATLKIQPIFGRFQQDYELAKFTNTLTEGIWVHYETDELGNFTGTFAVLIIGTSKFVNRFANKKMRWLAVASQAATLIS